MGKTLELAFNDRKLRVYVWNRFDNVTIIELNRYNEQQNILPELKAGHFPAELHSGTVELHAQGNDGHNIRCFSPTGVNDEMICHLCTQLGIKRRETNNAAR